MSEAELFTELTNLVEIDPFALIGISVNADEKRIAKRYRTIAKQLHPDALTNASPRPGTSQSGITPAEATEVIARIINPSYQKLKHDKNRQAVLTMLRLRMRRLVRSEKLIPTFEHAKQLANVEQSSVDIYYEQAISQLAQLQFAAIDQLYTCSLEIGQLNLVYLRRKTADTASPQKQSSEISIANTAANPINHPVDSIGPASVAKLNEGRGKGTSAPTPNSALDYVIRHIERAKTYLRQGSYDYAVQELREALKLSPQSPEIHSMLGQTYYKQSLTGMARAHFKQAYRLNPNHRVVKKYIEILGLTAELQAEAAKGTAQQKATATHSTDGTSSGPKKAWLGKLLGR